MSHQQYKIRDKETMLQDKKKEKKETNMIVFYVNDDTSEEHTIGV